MIELRGRALARLLAVTVVLGGLAGCDPGTIEQVAKSFAVSGDQAAQRKTMADLRDVGIAMMSWFTDQVAGAAAGQSMPDYDVRRVPTISRAELEAILVPVYLQAVPEADGWGHPYEFHLNSSDQLAQQVMTIRSPGRDGEFSGDVYTVGPFDPDHYDEDIVWSDGFFVRWPAGEARAGRPEKRAPAAAIEASPGGG